jgi:hypothetical protein
MPVDPVKICNLALARIGENRILSLDDEDPAARFCKLFYEPTRDEVLRAHTWNFAKKRQTLTKLSVAPSFGWANAFQLPSDFLRVVRVNQWEAFEADSCWVLEGDQILSDADAIELLYIRREEDATLYDPLFVKALSVQLASMLVTTLTGSREQGNLLMQEFERLVAPLAKRIDGMESRDKRKLPWVNSDLVNSRFGYGSF